MNFPLVSLRFHAHSQVCPISRASADQRAGRAGRVRSGVVYRMYTEDAYRHTLPVMTVPEMQRMEISSVILQV